jgi:hypothetical protein
LTATPHGIGQSSAHRRERSRREIIVIFDYLDGMLDFPARDGNKTRFAAKDEWISKCCILSACDRYLENLKYYFRIIETRSL